MQRGKRVDGTEADLQPVRDRGEEAIDVGRRAQNRAVEEPHHVEGGVVHRLVLAEADQLRNRNVAAAEGGDHPYGSSWQPGPGREAGPIAC